MPDHYFSKTPITPLKIYKIKTILRGVSFEFLTAPGVFSYRKIDKGTQLLIESMILPKEGCILDLGCGYGVIGIVAAKLNPKLKITMTDINERAIWLAKRNVELNQVKNIKVLQGDLYTPVINQKFDAIITNPPIHAGLNTVFKIIEKAPKHLNSYGTLQIIAKTKMGAKRISKKMLQIFRNVEEISKKSGYRIFFSRKTLKINNKLKT